MTLKRKVLFLSVGLLAIVLAVVILFVPIRRSEMTVKQLQALVEKRLPPGSSSAEVESILKEIGLQYSAGIKTKNVINASLLGTSRSLLVEGSIFAVFTFDESGKLLSYKIDEVFTGP